MCIIIDTNVLADVFNSESTLHMQFAPIVEWILKGKGKMVFGGSKYMTELKKAPRYLKLVVELGKINKTVKLDDLEVDKWEQEVKNRKRNEHRDFNDEHIAAMVNASGCKLVCTKDLSAVSFIKDAIFYPSHRKRPRIYSGRRNKILLVDANIAPICKETKRKKSKTIAISPGIL